MENRDTDIKDAAYYRSRWDYDAILEKAKIDFSLAGPCFGVILDLKEVIKELPLTEEGRVDMRGFNFDFPTKALAITFFIKQFGSEANVEKRLRSVLKYGSASMHMHIADAKSETFEKYCDFIYIILGVSDNIDFSFSYSEFKVRSIELRDDLSNCIFKDCAPHIKFAGKLTNCIFDHYIHHAFYFGSRIYNEGCIFNAIKRGHVYQFTFEEGAIFKNCTFSKSSFLIYEIRGVTFEDCKFLCTMRGIGLTTLNNIPDFYEQLYDLIKDIGFLGTLIQFILGRRIEVTKFVNCDLSKLKMINFTISKRIKFINCKLPKNLIHKYGSKVGFPEDKNTN